MLYWLSAFSDAIGPLNVLRYITFRTGGAMATAFVLVFLLAPYISALLRVRQVRPIHPTGLLILSAVLIATLLWANPANRYVWIVLAVALGFGLIGFRDDYLEAARQSSLSNKVRIAIAAAIASLSCLALMRVGPPQSAASLAAALGSEFDVAWLYIPIGALIIVAVGNIVDLADRLRWDVIRPLLLVALGVGFISYIAGNRVFADYLNVRYVPGMGEFAVLCGALTGAGMGFLSVNAPPATMFIGATGSLALGGMFGAMTVVAKREALLAMIHGLFVPAQG
jgi:phospho-N-acetylmuramoyl-pentapeptide-transferase